MTGALSRWNPLTPLAVALALVVGAYVGPQPASPIAALALALRLAGWSGVGRRTAALAVAVAVPTFALLYLMNVVVAPALPSPLVQRLTSFDAAARDAALIALRLGAAVAALGWIVLAIPPRRLTSALAQRGLPAWAAYVLVASLDAVPLARRRAQEVLEAQRCRGLRVGHGLGGRLRALGPLAGPLIVSLVSETEERALALDARAFDPGRRRTALDPIPDPRGERMFRLVLWLGIVGLAISGIVR